MLNTFPELLTYAPLAPFILRVVLGVILLDLGLLKLRGEKRDWKQSFEALRLPGALVPVYALLQIIGGLFLIVGFYTQPAALAFAIFTAIEFYIEYTESPVLKRDLVFYVLILAISISLILTGAGAYSVDIPL